MLFAGNMVRQPCFDGMRVASAAGGSAGYRVAGPLTETDRLMTDAFWVGVYPGLTEAMVEYLAGAITAAVGFSAGVDATGQ
jgi:CDP-6-deoxy-D-xylo-4-hexulose-3-dehydrase